MVANAFLPNPQNLPEIDHIDGDATNNKSENLRWVSHQENMKNETTRERLKKNGGDYVEIEEIATGRIFRGYQEASEATGANHSSIYGCCRHYPYHKTAGGFLWFYATDLDQPDKSKIILNNTKLM